MLVVSRKANQRIAFPNLGVSVEVIRVAGKTVRIGVDAPDDVRIVRSELLSEEQVEEMKHPGRKERHAFRNRLHTAQLALHLLQKQLDAGYFDDAEESLERALQSIAELDEAVGGGKGAQGRATEENAATPAGDENAAPSKRALVVEDNANERELLAGYLRLCGYEVDAVEDGLSAMDYLSKHERPDVVLLDMQMPRMDGRKTISAIRRNANYAGIKLFAVSGMDRKAMQVPLGDRGVNRWFSKPLNPSEFANELDAEMDRDMSCA